MTRKKRRLASFTIDAILPLGEAHIVSSINIPPPTTTQVYMPSRGMNAQKSDLISDPDVGKAFKYHAQYPGVMQGSQEGKRAKL